jgi:hypothetical protein
MQGLHNLEQCNLTNMHLLYTSTTPESGGGHQSTCTPDLQGVVIHTPRCSGMHKLMH